MSSKQEILETKIREALTPIHLEVENESHRHNVPKGSETHFKVVVVSPRFEGQNLVSRHRLIYGAVDAELKGKVIHALAIHAFTPAEWQAKGEAANSPDCLGGSKHDRKS